eukprot:UN25367
MRLRRSGLINSKIPYTFLDFLFDWITVWSQFLSPSKILHSDLLDYS